MIANQYCRENSIVNNRKGFVKAAGKSVINGEGNEILLRGVGLGGWLLPEGYMWCFQGQVDRPRRLEKMIEDQIGKEKAKQFWKIYFERYISEADIRQIAEEGFNSIRIPINSRHLLAESESESESICFNEEHVRLIDQVINWCKKYSLYAILDLHGAPGGQTGTNIDDSEKDKPELFTKEYNRQLTIELWRMLAERYKDERIVAGYDLLNEPLPEWFGEYNNQVMPLYKEIVEAIRQVDQNHMIILEGVHWSTNWAIFDEKIDDNLMLQFHKYWNNPDNESIQAFLDMREEWDVPIFMGEGGENNKDWYAGAFRLFEDHNISWNFWTWKKMDTTNSPCSINKPSGWELLSDFLKEGSGPGKAETEKILWEYLDNIHFSKCVYHQEVVNSLFRRPPVRIPAVFYGYRGEKTSYGLTGRSAKGIDFRVGDGTRICFVDETRLNPNFQHGRGEAWKSEEWMCLHLSVGDWYAYEFTVVNSSDFVVALCLCVPKEDALISTQVDGFAIETTDVKQGGWETVHLKKQLCLEPGLHRLVLKAEKNSVYVKWLRVSPWIEIEEIITECF